MRLSKLEALGRRKARRGLELSVWTAHPLPGLPHCMNRLSSLPVAPRSCEQPEKDLEKRRERKREKEEKRRKKKHRSKQDKVLWLEATPHTRGAVNLSNATQEHQPLQYIALRKNSISTGKSFFQVLLMCIVLTLHYCSALAMRYPPLIDFLPALLVFRVSVCLLSLSLLLLFPPCTFHPSRVPVRRCMPLLATNGRAALPCGAASTALVCFRAPVLPCGPLPCAPRPSITHTG